MKPTNMSPQQLQRLTKQKQVKAKIQQIMTSVKQQKQHIQNNLAINDHKIQLYSEQYQQLVSIFVICQKRQKNDFSRLKGQEEVLLKELVKSLYDNGVNAKEVIGGEEVGLNVWDREEYKELSRNNDNKDKDNNNNIYNNKDVSQRNIRHKKLSRQQIIAVQTLLIDKLTQQLKAKQK